MFRPFVQALNFVPVITSLNFVLGDTAGGGQTIVITGAHFTGATTVSFGATTASFSVVNDTTINATLPAHASGAVAVTVTNPSGTGGGNTFTYWSPTQITNIDIYLDSNKGVSGSPVTTWTDQAFSVAWSGGTNKPTQVSSVFGTLPSIRFAGNTNVEAPAKRVYGTGLSFFFVGKTSTSFSAATNPNFDAPGTVIGEINASFSWGGFGFSAGASCGATYTMFGTSTNPGAISRGSGLNDGNPRLIGVTSDTTPNRKIYVGTTQQGATDSPAGGYSTSNTSIQDIGIGLSSTDGFTGDLGAVIMVLGVISGGDLTNLNAWAQQRFGTP